MPSIRGVAPSLAIKLASLAVHVDEYMSDADGGQDVDIAAINGLLADPEVRSWVNDIPKELLPLKRNGSTGIGDRA